MMPLAGSLACKAGYLGGRKTWMWWLGFGRNLFLFFGAAALLSFYFPLPCCCNFVSEVHLKNK
jgi:hypothetical protein